MKRDSNSGILVDMFLSSVDYVYKKLYKFTSPCKDDYRTKTANITRDDVT